MYEALVANAAANVVITDTEFRYRTRFTKEQIRCLEEKFIQRPYIHKTQRLKFAEELKIPEETVRIWFQNRRTKSKKEKMTRPCLCSDPVATASSQFNLLQTAPLIPPYIFAQTSDYLTNITEKIMNTIELQKQL